MADNPGADLDGADLRNLDRFLAGIPPVLEGDILYRHEWDEDSGQFVLVPERPRDHTPVSWRGPSVS
jgi:hypothetical protein